jgi:hypothetical protein
MQNPVLANPGAGQGSRSRERAIMEKKQQSMSTASAQYYRDMELERIRQENVKERQDAINRQQSQYQNSAENTFA